MADAEVLQNRFSQACPKEMHLLAVAQAQRGVENPSSNGLCQGKKRFCVRDCDAMQLAQQKQEDKSHNTKSEGSRKRRDEEKGQGKREARRRKKERRNGFGAARHT